jgi:hypothetical protein
MRACTALAAVSFLLVAHSASAQSSLAGSGGVEPGDAQATPAAPATARQGPTVQPTAPTQPVSSQISAPGAAIWPSPGPGYPIAGGTLYPRLTAGVLYDDNVFATHANQQSDVVFLSRPELAWVTQGPNYSLGFDGFLEGRKYQRFSSDDQINGSVGAGFAVMPDSDTQLIGNARYIHAHLERGTSDTIGPGGTLLSTSFARPIAYDQMLEAAALNRRFDRWWTSLGVAGQQIAYDNATIPGAVVDLGYGNGVIGVANGRVGYVVMPLTSLFVEAAVNARDWRASVFDSSGYRVVGGILLEQGPGARVKGEAWAGYMSQDYRGISFQNVSTWTYGLELAFILTDRLTAVVAGRREAKEAALSLAVIAPGTLGADAAVCSVPLGASCVSVIESTLGARLDYRVLPDLVLGAGVTLLEDRYLGGAAAGRIDRTVSPLASLKYFPNDRVTLGFDYRHVSFAPTGGEAAGVAALSYQRNVYLFSISGRL